LRDLCSHLEPEEIRPIIQQLNRISNEKLEKAKPKKKASTKASLAGASVKQGIRSFDGALDRGDSRDADAADY
jgi:hypothetical protein